MNAPDSALAATLLEIEAEMKRIRFWSPSPEPAMEPGGLYAGLPSFEPWQRSGTTTTTLRSRRPPT